MQIDQMTPVFLRENKIKNQQNYQIIKNQAKSNP